MAERTQEDGELFPDDPPPDDPPPDDPFALSADEAARQIGATGMAQILELQSHLYGFTDRSRLRFRYAPSPITRTEIEIFSLSSPRFAIRVYLNPQRTSFVNARRIEEYANRVGDWGQQVETDWYAVIGGSRVLPALDRSTPKKIIESATCVGDCLLDVPERYRNYTVLQTELGLAYGEGARLFGTPYVRHIPLSGGGLCAQAVCFSAMSLRHSDPVLNGSVRADVLSVAEITALATGPETDEFPLTGLNTASISRVFEEIGIFPTWQYTLMRRRSRGDDEAPRVARFAAVLRAYLDARVPVILPVDMGKMAGRTLSMNDAGALERGSLVEPIFGRNRGLESYSDPINTAAQLELLNHAILVIGHDPDGGDFLINDPATFPFLTASLRQLYDAGVYAEVKSKDGKPPTLLEQKGMFFPVPPQGVRLPYFLAAREPKYDRNSNDYSTADARAGLEILGTAMRSHVQGGAAPFRLEGRPPPGLLEPCVALLRVKETKADRLGCLFRSPALRRVLDRGLEELDALALPEVLRDDCRLTAESWVWVERVEYLGAPEGSRQTLWVWDAGLEPPESPDPTRLDDVLPFLQLVAQFIAGRWDVLYRKSGALKPSVISSVSLRGTEAALDAIAGVRGKAVVDLDLYAFMQSDPLLRLFERVQPAPPPAGGGQPPTAPSAIARMAAAADSREVIGEVAAAVDALCQRNGARVAAFATFIPEITALAFRGGGDDAVDDVSPDQPTLAQNALCFLVELARTLKTVWEHPVSVIEIVAGSRIHSVWPYRFETASVDDVAGYMASKIADGKAMDLLCKRLEPVSLRAAGRTTPEYREQINLAVELEPGPLYILRDRAALVELCGRLDAMAADAAENGTEIPDLTKVVGLSLDVAHWRLADVGLDWLADRNDPAAGRVRNRIIHAHVSDHGKGHFGDCPPNSVNPGAQLRPWIDFLRGVAAANRDRQNLPNFSGYVSLELEACKNSSVLGTGIRNFMRLVSA